MPTPEDVKHGVARIEERGGGDTGMMIGSPGLAEGVLLLVSEGAALARSSGDEWPARIRVSGPGPVRLAVIMAIDGADLARSLDLLGRKGPGGLAMQRLQHARVVRDYGIAIESPDAELDRSLEWAKLDADAAALLAAGLRDPARTALRRLRPDTARGMQLARCWASWVGEPAVVGPTDIAPPSSDTLAAVARGASDDTIAYVIDDLWGVKPDALRHAVTLAPALPNGWDGMTLRRLRVGPTALACSLRRRSGRIVARVTRLIGPPINVTLSLRNQPTLSVAVDGMTLGGARARFDAGADHEVVFELPG